MLQVSIEVNGITIPLSGVFDLAVDEFTGRQSGVKQFISCHREYGWSRVENLEPEQPRWPLEFGSATHLFLQEHKRGVPMAEALKLAEARLVRDFKPAMFQEELEEREQYKELLRNLVPAYMAYWSDDIDVPIGNEIKGRVEVGEGTGVYIVFQVDQIVSAHGQFWIKDYKTMSKNDDRGFQPYEIDIQPTAYVYAVSKMMYGWKPHSAKPRIAGTIIDGLIKTKVPQFRRETFLRTDDDLAEFEREWVEVCREIAMRHARVQAGEPWKLVFYRNTQHCFKWGRACDFFQLCTKDSPMMRMAYKHRVADYMDDPTLLEAPRA